jgi:competence protein ComEA
VTPVARAQSQPLVNVNSADIKTLETLPGVGPATAQKIIDGRPFHSLEDLGKINGLSEARLETLKDKITFGTTNAATAKKAKKKKKAATDDSGTASSSSSSSSASSSAANDNSSAAAGAGSAASKLAPGEKININTASAADLDRLPGIGKSKAQAIIDYRTQNGPFKNLEDIEKVKGIKAGEYAKLKDNIELGD